MLDVCIAIYTPKKKCAECGLSMEWCLAQNCSALQWKGGSYAPPGSLQCSAKKSTYPQFLCFKIFMHEGRVCVCVLFVQSLTVSYLVFVACHSSKYKHLVQLLHFSVLSVLLLPFCTCFSWQKMSYITVNFFTNSMLALQAAALLE